jgi:ribosomal protein L32
MSRGWIRTWIEGDIHDIESHIVIAGDLTSDCGSCKEIGLDILKHRSCPHCGTPFKYVTSRLVGGAAPERYAILKRIHSKCPDLIFIDYDDYKKLTAKSKAEDFFRGTP